MRRLIFGVLACSIAILPTIAQDEYRLNRAPGQAQTQQQQQPKDDWVNDFSDAPKKAPATSAAIPSSGSNASAQDYAPGSAPSSSPSGVNGADFVIDINATQNRRQPPELPLQLPAGVTRGIDAFVKKLGVRELNLISSRDVIIIVDKSASMGDRDCPAPITGFRFLSRVGDPGGDISRWEWCESELVNLARMAGNALRQGLRVVMFSSDQQVYDHVSMNEIPRVFGDNYPSGSTNLAAALKAQLDWYFQAKASGQQRPIVIAVITDGLPNSTSALKRAIVNSTRQMNRPDEIAITFLQIGRDRHGVNLVHELDDDMVNQGAAFDIVDSKDFAELLQQGLGRALADAIDSGGRGVARN